MEKEDKNQDSSEKDEENSQNQACDQTVECWYCRKAFQKGPIYDEHYSLCYNRYAYMHM